MRYTFTAIVVLFLTYGQAVACSPARFDSVEHYAKTLLESETLAFIGKVTVLEKAEIDRFIFHQFEVEDDFLGLFATKFRSKFVGYTKKTENQFATNTCNISKGFEVGDSLYLTLYGLPENRYLEPYRIGSTSQFFGGYTPDEVKKQLELMQ